MPGTGSWLLSSDSYLQWLNSKDDGLLWIKGIPGSGKSVAAANIINQLATQSTSKSIVLFFFFRQIIDTNHNPTTLFRDWMDQLIEHSPPLQHQLIRHAETNVAIDSISPEDMWQNLKMAFANLPSKVFCVADALDEMDQGNDGFLEALGKLGHWRPEKVKVLVTSRPVSFRRIQNMPCLHIRLSENLVDGDISTYVRNKLTHSAIDQGHWPAIMNAVPGHANGLFLYARLAMDAFLEPGAVITDVLSRLPADLDVLYTDLLKTHASRSGVEASLQRLMLLAVTHASRPLRLLELAEMIRFNNVTEFQDIEATKNLVRAACGPLLEILADETVSVVHHSFTEYLRGTEGSQGGSDCRAMELGPTHAQLALICLKYLQGGSLDSLPASCFEPDGPYRHDRRHVGFDLSRRFPSEEEIRLRLSYPFFAYASSHWSKHINKFEQAGYDYPEVTAEVRRFLNNHHWLKAWVHLKWPTIKLGHDLVLPAHVAARLGLVALTKDLIKTFELDVADGSGRSPL
jgi:hypothetical protein